MASSPPRPSLSLDDGDLGTDGSPRGREDRWRGGRESDSDGYPRSYKEALTGVQGGRATRLSHQVHDARAFPGLCLLCAELGHRVKDCLTGPVCLRCGEVGHMAREQLMCSLLRPSTPSDSGGDEPARKRSAGNSARTSPVPERQQVQRNARPRPDATTRAQAPEDQPAARSREPQEVMCGSARAPSPLLAGR
ncbi:uncharacterized protein LOC104581921 [Brachypodium distachyon]|uniref:uncharacterized protein LOC104581921 n=1 Tax=Brachypodium distachyon TaxID=15368 RepID=UPI00053009FF|nr:uncharacterized protein LOC104581921 [Brachypodium distachyon]|eukprot:XP_010229389.1 uncharacterized protein LOC104581921 [Brachypodium distachyon]